MKLIAGLDIGNGYVKGMVQDLSSQEGVTLDLPSSVARVIYPRDFKTEGVDVEEVMGDLFNHLDVSIASNAVGDSARRVFGERALSSGNALEVFDVDSVQSKADQDLSGVLVLGGLAGSVLQLHKTLPSETLRAEVVLALALPIDEYMKRRVYYRDLFLKGRHVVTIHNFEEPLTIELTFRHVEVLAEGASAQLAITAKGEPFMDVMLKDLSRQGFDTSEISPKDILSAQNTIGIDIGEGTVNFPVFSGGRFNPDASMTFQKGYSTVLNNALEVLGPKYRFTNRKQLSDFLAKPPSKLQRARHDDCRFEVEKQFEGLSIEIKEQFSRVLRRVGAETEVIYVYGGGATDLKDSLYPKLLDETGGGYPILYLDSRWSRHLNREGLFLVAQKVASHLIQEASTKEET